MLFAAMHKTRMPEASEALAGRTEPMPVPVRHAVLDAPLAPPYPEGLQLIHFGMGCFWGAEKLFWEQAGVFTTAVGYGAGYTPNPTYREVCSGLTGHNELVRVVFDPSQTNLDAMFKLFWEGHDPTQGLRQGNDVGTQYRSGIYLDSAEQRPLADASLERFRSVLGRTGRGPVTTEIQVLEAFYFAEADHQQYLAKNPGGYCGLGGLGVAYPLSGR